MRKIDENFVEEVEFMREHGFNDTQIIEYLKSNPNFKGNPKEFVNENGSV